MLARSATTVTISKHGNFAFLLWHSALIHFPFDRSALLYRDIDSVLVLHFQKRIMCLVPMQEGALKARKRGHLIISLDMMPELKDIQ
jgi:hypothetical protein